MASEVETWYTGRKENQQILEKALRLEKECHVQTGGLSNAHI
jgi:hypothetical protein